VLRRSFATHNQKQLKNVQAHLGHQSTGTTADLYVVEIPEEVRRTQERYAAEIEALGKRKEIRPKQRKNPGSSILAEKLDATGRKFSKRVSISY
jgi:integrase